MKIQNIHIYSWAKSEIIWFRAVLDAFYTGKEEIFQIDFQVQSKDPKYHNLSLDSLYIQIWDDRAIKYTKSKENPYDWSLFISICVAVAALLCLIVSVLRGQWKKKQEWKLHHDLLSL